MKGENRHEAYLLAFALLLISTLILYNVYDTPELAPAKISEVTYTYTTSVEQLQAQISTAVATVPQEDIPVNTTKPSSANLSQSKTSGLVNLNQASEQELAGSLTGIGEVKAAAIVEYRNENGGFKTIEEIMNVKGIGEKTFEKIKGQITV